MSESQEVLAEILRAAGWTVIPPVDPNAAIPEPAVGQVWVSPKPRVLPRTVTKIAPHRWWPSYQCIYFTAQGSVTDALNPMAWRAWARKSGARPQ